MNGATRDYEALYRSRAWAYGDKPDVELVRALTNHPRGRALDIAGGQGRHALTLSALGFDVTLVDRIPEGLHQASREADEKGLALHTETADLAKYEPEGEFEVIVAALFFHIPARKTALEVAKRLGSRLTSGGLLYLSLPGYHKENLELAKAVLEEASCKEEWVVKHLVTKKDRPALSVPRRNETRALGVALHAR